VSFVTKAFGPIVAALLLCWNAPTVVGNAQVPVWKPAQHGSGSAVPLQTRLFDRVSPATYAAPDASTAMARVSSVSPPPRKVPYSSADPSGLSFAT